MFANIRNCGYSVLVMEIYHKVAHLSWTGQWFEQNISISILLWFMISLSILKYNQSNSKSSLVKESQLSCQSLDSLTRNTTAWEVSFHKTLPSFIPPCQRSHKASHVLGMTISEEDDKELLRAFLTRERFYTYTSVGKCWRLYYDL